jgi:hypothetical protein
VRASGASLAGGRCAVSAAPIPRPLNGPSLTTIEVNAEGVWCHRAPDHRWGIGWDEIHRVTAGKIDAIGEVWTTVELDFEFGGYIELNDSDTGFWDALEAICGRLPQADPDWARRIRDLEPGQEPLVLWSRDETREDGAH